MYKKEEKVFKMKYFLRGLRNILICDAIAALGLSVIAVLVALIRHTSIIESIYRLLYVGGSFVLLVSIPQFYKRSERNRVKDGKFNNPMFGFYDWFGGNDFDDKTIEESYEKFKGEGFWLGLMIVAGGTILILLAMVLEMMFFGK